MGMYCRAAPEANRHLFTWHAGPLLTVANKATAASPVVPAGRTVGDYNPSTQQTFTKHVGLHCAY